MRILLIEPEYPKVVLDTTSIPLGLASIATFLYNNGFDVTCFDGSISTLEGKFDYKEYDLIGIQFHSFESLSLCIELVKKIKTKTNAWIVAGGVVATFYTNELLKHKEIDFIILNEGEDSFLKLVTALSKNENINTLSGIAINAEYPIINHEIFFRKDIDFFPIPNRKLFEWQKYKQWSIVTSRGCPYKCKFCTIPSFWKNTYRQRSPENIFQEIQYLATEFQVKKIFILDDTFTVNKQRTIALLSLLKDSDIKIEWACLTRADLLDAELLQLMKETGCSTISLGVESANQDTLDFLDKNIKLKTIEDAISLIKKYDIRVRCSFIFGFPNENETHLINNISFLKKTKPNEVQIYPLFPYFGTELNRDKSIDVFDFSLGKDALNPIFETQNLSKEIISKYVKECVEDLQKDGYVWLSSYSIPPQKSNYNNVVMTEFAPIQSLSKDSV